MVRGVELSLARLTATQNEAAVDTLLAALDNAREEIRFEALRALLARRGAMAYREVIRRWPQYPASWLPLFEEHPGRLEGELQSAALSGDRELAEAACQAAVALCDYDLIAPLIAALESRADSDSMIGPTLLKLVDCLSEELSQPRDYNRRRDPQLVRRFVVAALESSVGRFTEHHCLEPIEAFLALAARDNATLRSCLQASRGELHAAAVAMLTESPRPGVIRLLMSFLDEPQAPLVALQVIAQRGDPPLVAALLEKMRHDGSAEFTTNLARLKTLPWAAEDELIARLPQWTEPAQQSAARVIMHSGIKPPQKRAAMIALLRNGRSSARSVATAALAEFVGIDISELIYSLIDDPDPQVQACALVQLRQRNIPGAISLLIKRLESPAPVVRNAARSCLREFTFARFLAAFEDMSPDIRRSTGALVTKVDPQAIPSVIAELHHSTRTCRLRAMEIASLLGNDRRLQAAMIACLLDSDHQVRAEAARKLAEFPGEPTVVALRKALADPSVTVQDAAEQSLEQLGRPQPSDEKSTIQWAALLEAGIRAQR